MRSLRILITTGAALGAILIGTSSASAVTPAPTTVTTPTAGSLSQAEEQQRAGTSSSRPVIATYKGKRINLGEDWQGAQICAETLNLEFKCFDTQAEADAGLVKENAEAAKRADRMRKAAAPGAPQQAPAAIRKTSDCAYGWVCLWQDINYEGRRLQWNAQGHKKMGDYIPSFRDKATSICVNRPLYGATLIDYRDFQIDPTMSIPAGSCYNLTDLKYVHGGTWNDRTDAMDM